MGTVHAPRSDADIQRDIVAIKRQSTKLMRSSRTARQWLIKNGFVTKSGRLTKRYGG